MSDQIPKELLEKLIEQIDRLATALEKVMLAREKSLRCTGCMGDGKGYDGHGCRRCGGTGMRNPP
jgi:rRNA maturation endonuclease Nob1